MENTSESIEDTDATTKYYCHNCRSNISSVTDDLKCPTCNLGFQETSVNNESTAGNENISLPENVNERQLTPPLSSSNDDNRNEEVIGNPVQETMSTITINGRPGDGSLNEFLSIVSPELREFFIAMISTIAHRQNNVPPLSEEEIEQIPISQISQDHLDMNLQCHICLELFSLHEEVFKLSCNHMFHKDCLIPWLKMNSSCPICRKKLIENPRNPPRDLFDEIEGESEFMAHLMNVPLDHLTFITNAIQNYMSSLTERYGETGGVNVNEIMDNFLQNTVVNRSMVNADVASDEVNEFFDTDDNSDSENDCFEIINYDDRKY